MVNNKISNLINSKLNNKISTLILKSIGFNLNSLNKKNYNSKIGGNPTFMDLELLTDDEDLLTFLGQIDLLEISDVNTILPNKGMLYFFILTNDIGHRYPDRKGEFKVIYTEKQIENKLVSINDSIIKENFIDFFENISFPSYQDSIIESNNIKSEDLEIIEEIENEIMFLLNNDYDVSHQLLGHPYALQGTVKFWWAIKYLNIEQKDNYTKEEYESIKAEEENFILLLQLNFGDSKIGFDYFGEGVAYFGIHKNDLKNKNFENAVLVIQNT